MGTKSAKSLHPNIPDLEENNSVDLDVLNALPESIKAEIEAQMKCNSETAFVKSEFKHLIPALKSHNFVTGGAHNGDSNSEPSSNIDEESSVSSKLLNEPHPLNAMKNSELSLAE